MSGERSQDGSNTEVPEVSSRYVSSPDDIAMYIKRMRESTPSLFTAVVGSIFVEYWTWVMSQNFKALSIPKNVKVKIACMLLRRTPAV